MSDVVLIFPKSSFLEKAMEHYYLPLSLLNCAVYVEKEYSVKIIDQRTEKFWQKKLLREINQNPICIGLTSLTGEQIKYALEISRFVKHHSEIPVVWGGIHPSILPGQTLRNPNIDYVIIGEGEISFYELIKSLEKKRSLRKLKGIGYKSKKKLKINPPGKTVDMNSLPELPYHLVDIKNYILRYNKKRMFIMESSRGCPYNCSFCCAQYTPHQEKWRALSPENTISAMSRIKDKFNIDGIEFQDLNSFVDLGRMRNICGQIVKEKMDIFWNTCGRITDIMKMDSSYLNLLEKSNMKRFALGVESGSDRILKLIKKGITVRQVIDAGKKISRINVSPVYSFMAGFPTENERELKQTTSLIMKLLKENKNAKTSILHCYRPLPGNELFDLSVEHGLVPPDSLEEWGNYSMDKIDYPWLSQSMQSRIKALNFLSLFLDKKHEEIDNPFVQSFAKLYKPIARYRFSRNNFAFMFEPVLKKIFVNVKEKLS
ncbi:B12-binding domain-containing radical SAM protein [Candidatus Woesearchaeota archaeon]|nr:B12-binding domain-containing radical SAM protein [Candidatus Woesearchaeota archaeon]